MGSNVKFSLILPTRGRVGLVEQFFGSIFNTVSNLDNIEILVCVDSDDKPTVDFFKKFTLANLQTFVDVFPEQKGLTKYYNYGASKSRGKYFWCLNDDVEFLTRDWDIIIESEIEAFVTTNRIVYVHVEDDIGVNSNQKNGPCAFPVLTSEFYKLTGWIVPPQMVGWNVDWAIAYLFDKLKYNRYLNLRNQVKLIHNCFHNGRRQIDDTYLRVRSLENHNSSGIPYEEIDRCIEIINRYMDGKRN